MEKGIAIHNITKEYQDGTTIKQILNSISFCFKKGISYSIIGASGVGKSTLLHILAGIDNPTSGAVLFDEVNIASLSEQEKKVFLNKTIGIVFQSSYFVKELSVIENVMLPGLIAEIPYEECLQTGYSLLEQIDLKPYAWSNPKILSGGQQKRIALARALFNKPSILCIDEPTGNLDTALSKTIINLIIDFQKREKGIVIINSHDHHVIDTTDTILELKLGTLSLYEYHS